MKEFLIISTQNAVTYKDHYTMVKDGKFWMGYSRGRISKWFEVPQNFIPYNTNGHKVENGKKYQLVDSICWLTNLHHSNRDVPLQLTKQYDPEKYPRYSNCDAIDCGKTADIPVDYDGIIGVPISFLSKHCPKQFDLIGFRKGDDGKDLQINGRFPYFRVLIRKKANCV